MTTRSLQLSHRLAWLGTFVVFAAMFAVPSGYSYGGVFLLLGALLYLAQRPDLSPLDRDDRAMVAVLLAYGVVPSFMTWLLGNNPSDYDQYSRSLLALPIFLALCFVRVPLPVFFGGTALGIVLAAPLAWWQVNVQGMERAGGFLNMIHFGNLSLVFMFFCIAGFWWAPTQGRFASRWKAAFLLGCVCGLYGVIMSGSRGSWIAVPPVVILLLAAFLGRHNARRIIFALLLGMLAIAALFARPDSFLRARYDRGVENLTQYQQGDTNTSVGARFEMWRGAWANLRMHPVSGWNVAEYTEALERQVDAGTLTRTALRFNDNLHNNYLQAWVFTGLPGLLALLALYAMPFWHFVRRLRDADMTVRVLAFCGTSLVASYICFSLTQVILRRNNGIMFYLLAVIILWGAMRHARLGSPALATPVSASAQTISTTVE